MLRIWKSILIYSDWGSQENLGVSALKFCIRSDQGDLVYVESYIIGELSATEAEIRAVKEVSNYCVQKGCLPLTVETDSLIAKKILDGVWEVPWIVSKNVSNIKFSMHTGNVEVVHTFREGNKVANFFD